MMNGSQVRVIDPILSNVVLGYRNAKLVGEALFPRVPVQVSGGKVIQFDKSGFLLFNSARTPGSNTKRVQFGYEGVPYALDNHSLEGQVPFEHMRDAKAVPGIDLGSRSTRLVMGSMLLKQEFDQASIALNAANYSVDNKIILVGASQWSHQDSDPVAAVNAGKEAVREQCGLYPNTFEISAKVFAALKGHPKIIERIKYTGRDSVTAEILAALFDVDKVVVGSAIYSPDGETTMDVWGKDAVLAYVPGNPSGLEEPSYGYTYVMEGHPLVEEAYVDRNAKSWIYPVSFERKPVLTGISSGYLFKNAVA